MTRVLACAFLAVLCAQSAFASQETSVHPGALSLELQLQPTSGAIRYGIAAKYHVSDRSAARVGFLYSYSSSDGDGSSEESVTTTTSSSTETYHFDSSNERHSGSVFLHFARYVRVQERLSVTWELGPVFAWSHYEDVDAYLNFAGAQSTYELNVDRKDYGLELQAGFEWHFIGRLSLAARYGVSGTRSEGHGSQIRDLYDPISGDYDVTEDKTDTDGFSVQTTNGVFSLLAYW